ncbi:glutamate 5-kinase [Scatolibacter rhodanostii]|uniref:glutamate 5-kinase n=1 Tax=Scatolibacter rhodanostii TaxID=2014781 RepID=UPI000C087C52|nr:glutamate 5-kinase [Scatolibacter rhodanostii]
MKSIQTAKRIVIKVGTSTLTHENGKLNLKRMDEICRVISDLQNADKEIVLVTSGAIGVGVGKLSLPSRPSKTEEKQAIAAIGQCELMFMYDKFFSEYDQVAAQILLTKNITDRSRKNVQNTFNELFRLGAVPVVNENDTVETAELEGTSYGDNDMLSAIVSELIHADSLVIFTDIDGLYDADPRNNPNANIIHQVDDITDEIRDIACGSGSNRGTGGMSTKIYAADFATSHGIPAYIMNGSEPENLYKLINGETIGTYFVPANV